jgi:hypothetical protein
MDRLHSAVEHILSVSLRVGLILVVIQLTSFSTFSQANLIPNKYLKIRPGVTTRIDVEKIYGKNSSADAIIIYKWTEYNVAITYSESTCDSSDVPWAFPVGIVEEISYHPNESKPLRLRSVINDISRFKTEQTSDVITHVKYFNEKSGIFVVYDSKEKVIESIIIRPTLEQKRRFACSQ